MSRINDLRSYTRRLPLSIPVGRHFPPDRPSVSKFAPADWTVRTSNVSFRTIDRGMRAKAHHLSVLGEEKLVKRRSDLLSQYEACTRTSTRQNADRLITLHVWLHWMTACASPLSLHRRRPGKGEPSSTALTCSANTTGNRDQRACSTLLNLHARP